MQEFSSAYVALGRDYAALARGLEATGAFQALYPASLRADAAIAQFLTPLGLEANAQALSWMQAQVSTGQTMGQVMVRVLESTEPSFAQAQKLLAHKAAVADYYAVVQQGDASELAYLQSLLSKVRADSDVSTPAAIEALIAEGTGQAEPENPEPDNPEPDTPSADIVLIDTAANASTSLSNLATGKAVLLSGRNQTLGPVDIHWWIALPLKGAGCKAPARRKAHALQERATQQTVSFSGNSQGRQLALGSASNAEQRFNTIALEAARGETLQLTLGNAGRVDARLLVNLLVLRDDPQSLSNPSAVRTLQLVSSGQRETHNYIETIDAARVQRFELSGTQKLDISINNAANYQELAAQVKGLTVDGSAMTGALQVWMESALANAVDLN